VKKNGQPLNEHDQQKETERVTKLVEKAQKTPPDQPLEGQTIRVSRLLDIMDVRNPRREQWRDRPAIVFDFVGRKNARTHGLAEDASKKLSGRFGSMRPTARWPISKWCSAIISKWSAGCSPA